MNTYVDETSTTGAADQWLWAFGDGMTSTLASPVHTYTVPAVYSVTQWVTDTATAEADVVTRSHYIAVSSGLGDLVTTTITYDCDPLYRLTEATCSSGEVDTYTYDQVGNRLAQVISGTLATTHIYNSMILCGAVSQDLASETSNGVLCVV